MTLVTPHDAQRAAAESEVRAALELMPQLVWTTTADGYHDYYNERWYAYTGMPRPGDPTADAEGWNWKNYLHPDDYERTVAAWARCLATGDPYEIEYRFKEQATGRYRWFLGRALPRRDAEGRIVRWFGTCTDIHEQRLAAEQLAAAAERFAALSAASPVGIFDADLEGNVTYANPRLQAIWGATEAEMLGAGWAARVHPDDAGPLATEWRAALAAEQPYEREYRLVLPDGAVRVVHGRSAVIRDRAGRALGTVGTIDDVTAERAAEAAMRRALAEAEAARARAEEATRVRGQFLATMSHELRTPLNAIQGHVQLLELGLHGPLTAEQRSALGRIQRAQRHLLGLINDVLNYARLESGRVEYAAAPVDLAEAVADVLPMVEPQAAARGLALAGPAGPSEPVVAHADGEKVAQVLLNLLSNAVKFTPAGGRVWVEVAPAGGAAGARLAVRVCDTGVGIPADKLEAVFEPFVQVRGDYAPAEGGTGLGLAISRDLARGMGGDLTAESTPGVGSVFTLTLPAQAEGAAAPSA